MKVKGSVKRTQTIEGTIAPHDLLVLIRETFSIPDGATATFHVADTGTHTGALIQAQLGWPPTPLVQVTDGNPVRFRVEWSLPVGEAEQG
jgi:hypothetical protein